MPDPAELSPDVAAALDAVLDRYETDRKAGRRPEVDGVLAGVDPPLRPAAAAELEALRRHYDEQSAAEATVLPGQPADTGRPADRPRVRYVGDFELLEEIARGGMGVVWRARQSSLGREVALKMILHADFASEEMRRRFQTEAEAAARLDHPGIVPIYETGTHESRPYFAMKFVQGRDLKSAADDFADPRAAADLVARISEAVHHAHQRGIVHRDLKPGNVLLERTEGGGEAPLLTDFGLARNLEGGGEGTRTGAVLGTPQYMPPEQARGEAVTTAADIYALGAILYRLVTGRPPHEGESSLDVVRSLTTSRPPSPRAVNAAVDRGLEAVILKCLSQEPSARYASAAELAGDLRSWAEGRPLIARPATAWDLIRLWLRDHFGNAGRVPVIAAAVGLISGFGWWLAVAGGQFRTQYPGYRDITGEPPQGMIGLAVAMQDTVSTLPVAFTVSLTVSLGMAVWLAVRPKTPAMDTVSGLAAGLIAGGFFFAGGFGALVDLAVSDATWQDVRAGWGEGGDDALVGLHPQWRTLEEASRMRAVRSRAMLDRIVDPLIGGWLGLFVSLLVFGVIGTVQTVVYGRMFRRAADRWWPKLSASLEYLAISTMLVWAGFAAIGWAAISVAYGRAPILLPWPAAALGLLMAASAAAVWVRTRFVWPVACAVGPMAGAVFFLAISAELRVVPIARLTGEIDRAYAAVPDLSAAPRVSRWLALKHLERAEEYANVRLFAQRFHHQAAADAVAAETLVRPLPGGGGPYSDGRLFGLGEATLAEAAAFVAAAHSLMADRPQAAQRWRQLFDDNRRLAGRAAWTATVTTGSTRDQQEHAMDGLAPRLAATLPEADRPRVERWLRGRATWFLYQPRDVQPLTGREAVREALDGPPLDAGDWEGPLPEPEVRWRAVVGGYVGIAGPLGWRENAVATLASDFHTDAAGPITFRFGSDDGAAVWVDGRRVHVAARLRQHHFGEDVFTVDLPAGPHRVAVIVAQGRGPWQMSLTAEDRDGMTVLP